MLQIIRNLLSIVLLVCLLPNKECFAHAKWFTEYDLNVPPLSIIYVLGYQFYAILLVSLIFVFACYIIDDYWYNSNTKWTILRLPLSKLNPSYDETTLLRLAMGIFFVVVGLNGSVILTPELHTESTWVSILQIGMAMCLLFKRTLLLTGVGIMTLYAYAISEYGVFHLADYTIFLGIACYFIISSIPHYEILKNRIPKEILTYRLPILYVFICVTLLWASIEKLVYPQWIAPLFNEHPNISIGIELNLFTKIAGFVEFTLAFMMLTGRMLQTAAAGVLTLMFVSAIAEFGKIDAIGHLPIIAALIVMMSEGQQSYITNNIYKYSAVNNAFKMVLIYPSILVMFFVAYYGLYALSIPGLQPYK